MLRSLAVAMVVACAIDGALAAEPAKTRVGVFDQHAAGGQGATIDGLLEGLGAFGYDVQRITDLDPISLADCDIVYLCDLCRPGQVDPNWRKNLEGYVTAGGSVLQTWHHHLFRQIGTGILRIENKRQFRVRPGHPAVDGIEDFQARYSDHIIERVGPNGTVLLENEAGQPVAAAGPLGRGRVISTGIALALPDGHRANLSRGPEREVLEAFLKWLEPEVPRSERVAKILEKPQLTVSPSGTMVAAGFSTVFRARVGASTAMDVKVECPGEGISIEPDPGQSSDGGLIRAYRITVSTESGKDVRRELVVTARAGDAILSKTVPLEVVAARPPKDEVRGVWLHVRDDRHPKDVMPELKRLGIGMAVLRSAGGTAAFYASKVQPDVQDPLAPEGDWLAPEGDWLAETVRHAHANGIEIHPYVNNCVVEGRTSKESLARLRAAGRLQEDPEGNPIDWFCPSQEANLEAIERPMIEIVTRYDVDGIQYDFIRYPSARGCFCPKCRELFERETGRPVAQWPEDVISGSRHEEWVEFRCRRISALVQRISTRIREVNPKVKISAAVFRDWPACRENNGQDWVRWCREGWLDFVCPMNYTLSPELFAERAKIHREALPKGFPIVQGIGIDAGQGQMHEPAELAVQIALARRAGAAGFVGFAYQPKHTATLFAPLQEWMEGE